VDSPLGPILLIADDTGRLTGLRVGPAAASGPPDGNDGHVRADGAAALVLAAAAEQLEEYFAGRRTRFSVPLAPAGTPFQRRVWDELMQIGFGTTVSYGELAARAGRPGAARAVGHANAHNPIAVIVPCHRVIGASGALTGYGGGIEAKRFLLDLERRGRRRPPWGSASGSGSGQPPPERRRVSPCTTR
jgi:methylated-DNA-[protein]-cysteine S-methyltransferase